ncbi:uncharacterized protein CC84DRAFT_1223732 [Paraphaeosphaeria sporulosa]|uniref:Uncharacterized protein n=1 Tax=Paraphaeosphaeria sporulosa TaxID=1460663 RepID=A0A177BU35_9PLEO|nr:uncharacterized protein CC84DRAFT_1223732 [Paraphaeosphaeria sporulosa]OAF98520.1 hypothetical protein CC84DRAFT_1223732 [Paraphaeosphaeria sporulosa]
MSKKGQRPLDDDCGKMMGWKPETVTKLKYDRDVMELILYAINQSKEGGKFYKADRLTTLDILHKKFAEKSKINTTSGTANNVNEELQEMRKTETRLMLYVEEQAKILDSLPNDDDALEEFMDAFTRKPCPVPTQDSDTEDDDEITKDEYEAMFKKFSYSNKVKAISPGSSRHYLRQQFLLKTLRTDRYKKQQWNPRWQWTYVDEEGHERPIGSSHLEIATNWEKKDTLLPGLPAAWVDRDSHGNPRPDPYDNPSRPDGQDVDPVSLFIYDARLQGEDLANNAKRQ